ncbi:MAG TPA: hypothetical protein VG225_13075 [Terracidiphilus sp.]|nr:hypothetical protein [Terracidiphilus sp.]
MGSSYLSGFRVTAAALLASAPDAASTPDAEQVWIQAARQAQAVTPAEAWVAFPAEALAAIPAAGWVPDVTPDAALVVIPDAVQDVTPCVEQEQAVIPAAEQAAIPDAVQGVIPVQAATQASAAFPPLAQDAMKALPAFPDESWAETPAWASHSVASPA